MVKKTTTLVFIIALAVALSASMVWSPPASASEPFLGQIQMFGFNFAPRGWAFCDGQLLPISQNTALFSLLGTTFGGDGRTTFALPDLRGRTAVHPGAGPGLSPILLGQRGGADSHTLTIQQMPSHNHTGEVRASSARGAETSPDGHVLADDAREDQYVDAAPDVSMAAGTIQIGNTGGGQSFSIRDPFLGIYHSIALMGVYPSRN